MKIKNVMATVTHTVCEHICISKELKSEWWKAWINWKIALLSPDSFHRLQSKLINCIWWADDDFRSPSTYSRCLHFFRCLKNIRSCKCFVDGMNSCVTNFFLLLKDNCTQLSVHILHNMLVSTLLFLSDVPSHRKRAMDKK